MQYMIIERFKSGDAVPVYRRFRERGRMMPEGLRYVASWIDEEMRICFQLMETDDAGLFEAWMSRWRDLMDFEVYPVITSDEARARIAPRL